jgi:hypothetical protein
MTAQAYEIYPKVLQVLDLLSAGRTLTSACDEAGVSIATYKSYIKHTAELTSAHEEAMQRGYDAMADALVEIDRHEHYGSSDPKQQKVMSDNIKWLLSKRDNKRFGDRVSVDVNVTADKAIVNALSRARSRAALPAATPLIDITPTLVENVGVDDDEAILAEILS